MFVCSVPSEIIHGARVVCDGGWCPLRWRFCHGTCSLWAEFGLECYGKFLETDGEWLRSLTGNSEF